MTFVWKKWKRSSSRNGITSLLADSQTRRRSWELWRKQLFMYNCDSYSAAQWFGIRGPRGGGDGAEAVGRHFKGLKWRFSNKNSMSTKTITLKLKVNILSYTKQKAFVSGESLVKETLKSWPGEMRTQQLRCSSHTLLLRCLKPV